jgi:Ca2+-binding EF-hand superfamily protein
MPPTNFLAHCCCCSTEMLDMCKKYDKDGNGTIEFEEFLEMSKVRHSTAFRV